MFLFPLHDPGLPEGSLAAHTKETEPGSQGQRLSLQRLLEPEDQ